jgi:hypothetical protein
VARREIIVHLPEQPEPGEIIELPDGTRVTVDRVEPSSPSASPK